MRAKYLDLLKNTPRDNERRRLFIEANNKCVQAIAELDMNLSELSEVIATRSLCKSICEDLDLLYGDVKPETELVKDIINRLKDYANGGGKL